MEHLTWTCHVCGDERPDDKISVFTKPLVFPGGVVAKQNIRYCNDRQGCIDGAPEISHVKDRDK